MTREIAVVITTRLDGGLVDGLRRRHPNISFTYPEELLPVPRYSGEHRFAEVGDEDVALRWRELLESAEVLFDFGPAAFHQRLFELENLRWIQATSAGVGQFVHRIGLDSNPAITVTTASGVHGAALAEFVAMALIYFSRDMPVIEAGRKQRHWQRRCGRLIAGQEIAVVGMGGVGREIARLLGLLGGHVTGVVRDEADHSAGDLGVERVVGLAELDSVLRTVDAVVLAVPHTEATEDLLSASRIAMLRPDAVVINVARGAVVDEGALTEALLSERLRGAALDVFRTEPLPRDSPLWACDRVLVTPHSMSTVEGENQRLCDLFSENLARYESGRPLVNVLDPRRMY